MAFILTTLVLSGQYTFNSIYSVPSSPTSFNTVNISANSYIISGVYLDTVGTNYLGLVISKLDNDGSIIVNQLFGSAVQEFNSIGHSRSYLPDLFLHQSKDIINDTTVARIVWLDSNADTIFTKDYKSHNAFEDYPYSGAIQPYYCTINPDSTAYLANGVAGETTWNDAALQKLDKDGNTLWIYDHATMSDPDMILGIVPREDGVIYAAIEWATSSYATRHKFVKLSQTGELQWELNSNNFQPNVGQIGTVVLDQNCLIAACCYRAPEMTDYFPIACVYKVDTLEQLQWMTTYGEYNDDNALVFTNVVQTTDGNYVAAGTWKTIPGTEEIPEGYTAVDYDEFAYVVKFDREDGSIIWDRKYRWLEVYRDNHTLRDMKATPDGGVIFCGEVKDFYMQQFEDFQQRGWVVKLDECGCLVPGCDTSCTDIGVREQSGVLPLLLSPNPTSDILNVHVGGYSLSKDAALQIIDLGGRIVSTNSIPANNTTYMMRVDELPAGNYVVRLMNDGGVVATGTVVVM
jgi:hypothetical protein